MFSFAGALPQALGPQAGGTDELPWDPFPSAPGKTFNQSMVQPINFSPNDPNVAAVNSLPGYGAMKRSAVPLPPSAPDIMNKLNGDNYIPSPSGAAPYNSAVSAFAKMLGQAIGPDSPRPQHKPKAPQ